LASHHTAASCCTVAPPSFSWLSCCPVPWPPSPSHHILLFWLVVALRSQAGRPPSSSHCAPLLRLVVTTRCPAPQLPPPLITPPPLVMPLLFRWLLHRVTQRPGLPPPLVTRVGLSSCCGLLFVVVFVVIASLPAFPEEERTETRKRPPALVDCQVPPPMADNRCAMTSSSLDMDNAKMHTIRSCYCALTVVVTKKHVECDSTCPDDCRFCD
jgi:hypothetical protein